MLFNSLEFLIFLVVIITVYYMIPHRFRWFILLVGSYYFYMSWNPALIILILITTIITYISARLMKYDKWRKTLMIISVISCLGILFFFKYFELLVSTVVSIANLTLLSIDNPTLNILLPVGISFYTFQTLSYVIDVYNKKIEPEKHFGIYALFICFFPQLVAGPIERPQNLIPQLKTEKLFSYDKAIYGVKLMIWGFFKKIVIADSVASFVNLAYNNVEAANSVALVIATFLFAIQIFCDFSAYTDIARGCANILGIDLMDNFKQPYLSKNIKEFWSRWHISLSSWFRDYVYIPMGGNRVKKQRFYFNLLVTFVLSGLWHGANYTFIVWGLLHGLYLVVYNLIKGKSNSLESNINIVKAINVTFTFLIVCFAWIFFRANSMNDAIIIVDKVFSSTLFQVESIINAISFMGLNNIGNMITLVISISILIAYEIASKRNDVIDKVSKMNVVFRWSMYTILSLLVLVFKLIQMSRGQVNDFIYFQF